MSGGLDQAIAEAAVALFTLFALQEARTGWIGQPHVDQSVEPGARWRLRTRARIAVGWAGIVAGVFVGWAAGAAVLLALALMLWRPREDVTVILRSRFKRLPPTGATPHAPAVGEQLARVLSVVTVVAAGAAVVLACVS